MFLFPRSLLPQTSVNLLSLFVQLSIDTRVVCTQSQCTPQGFPAFEAVAKFLQMETSKKYFRTTNALRGFLRTWIFTPIFIWLISTNIYNEIIRLAQSVLPNSRFSDKVTGYWNRLSQRYLSFFSWYLSSPWGTCSISCRSLPLTSVSLHFPLFFHYYSQ